MSEENSNDQNNIILKIEKKIMENKLNRISNLGKN